MRIIILAVLAVVLMADCSKRPSEPKSRSKLTQKEFVSVVFDLERAAPATRAAILHKHQTTAAEVRDFVVKNSVDPVALGAAFDSVQARLDRLHPPVL